MHHFFYKNGQLHAEDVPICEIAQDVGTPFYCYASATLEHHYRVFSESFSALPALICYAMKANSNQSVLTTLARMGAGMDIVSEGELRRALAAGVPAQKILFSGVGKTEQEMVFALEQGIFCFNVESEPELTLLSKIAADKGLCAPVSLRINPDIDSQSHKKISTGKATDKFGIAWEEARDAYRRAAHLPGIRICGIDMHIGSQITQIAPFERAFSRLAELIMQLREDGHVLTHIDLGGGLGIPYRDGDATPPSPREYAAVASQYLGGLDCQIILEPGRLICGNAGILVTKLLYVKTAGEKTFYIVDAAMNDLIRPTLYEAWHEIKPVHIPTHLTDIKNVDVVGPVCETGDFFAQNRTLPGLDSNALLAVFSAGAYGAVNANTYNSRRLIPEVMVKEKAYAVIRPRQSYDALIGCDRLASWLR